MPRERVPLLVESTASESLQKLFANICGQLRVRGRDVCNRPVFSLLHRSCQKGVDLAHMRPAEHRSHARDLSAFIDRVSHGDEEVGIRRKQRVKLGHHAIRPDEAMRPVEAGVVGASYHLAPVVDAGGYSAKISRQSLEVCNCAVLPKNGQAGCTVRAATLPNNLAPIVNGPGDVGTLDRPEARKGEGIAVFPHYGVKRRGAVSRVAYGLAPLVDALRLRVWIATYRRKSLGFVVFPYHRQINLRRRGSWA